MPGEPSILPVAVFITSNTHPSTWWPLCFLHVGPVLHPSLLHHGPFCSPFPYVHMQTHLNTHTDSVWVWGLSLSIIKTRSGRSGAVIIFIINFHLKVAPGLFCPLQSSFQAPCIHIHTHTPHHHYYYLWKGCVPNKAEHRGTKEERAQRDGKCVMARKEVKQRQRRQEGLNVSLHHSLDPNLH